MHYVTQAERVRADGGISDAATAKLIAAEEAMFEAEQEQVRAYGLWRAAMQLAADTGSTRAADYLKGSEWDLT